MQPNGVYRYDSSISNDSDASFLPAIRFQPDGKRFAVAHRDKDLIRIIDTDTLELVRKLENPEAQLDFPHGLALTDRYVIVSNKHRGDPKPSTINVFDIESESPTPVCVFRTPIDYLVEAHTLTVDRGRLLVSYCEGKAALVSYRFDEETGQVSGPVDVKEDWFDTYGDPKGVAFSKDGSQALVTFVSVPPRRDPLNNIEKLILRKQNFRQFMQALNLDKKWPMTAMMRPRDVREESTNGMALFEVSPDGHIADTPSEFALYGEYARPENVHLQDDICVVSDPLNNNVSLYAFDGAHVAGAPAQVLSEQLFFPHDACLSPDLRTLVVSNNGVRVVNGRVLFNEREDGGDTVAVYRLDA